MSTRDDLIRERAHAIWLAEGRPEGRHEEHWRRAAEAVDAEERGAAKRVHGDAEGQFAASQAEPQPDGLSSANPTVLSGDGDATAVGWTGEPADSEPGRTRRGRPKRDPAGQHRN